MPEGHTIHRLAKDHRADLGGRAVAARSAQARFVDGARRLDGQALASVDAWGKHLFHEFRSGDILHVHLGLIGKWFRRTGAPLPAMTGTTRLRLATDDVAWDLTGPMTCELVGPDERDLTLALLGPDPLRADADPDRAWQRIHDSARSIGLLLLEQDVIAGIGNVYRSEVLNIVGIDPRRRGRDLERAEFDALWAETVHQLRLGVRRNRIVTMRVDELSVPVSRLANGEGRYVYKRAECGRCHTALDVFPIAGRTTWRCPTCQPR